MFDQGDRVYVQSGPYAGNWATVVKADTEHSFPLTAATVDHARIRVSYSFQTSALLKGSRCTALAIREA